MSLGADSIIQLARVLAEGVAVEEEQRTRNPCVFHAQFKFTALFVPCNGLPLAARGKTTLGPALAPIWMPRRTTCASRPRGSRCNRAFLRGG